MIYSAYKLNEQGWQYTALRYSEARGNQEKPPCAEARGGGPEEPPRAWGQGQHPRPGALAGGEIPLLALLLLQPVSSGVQHFIFSYIKIASGFPCDFSFDTVII